jgi:hypothetical protein
MSIHQTQVSTEVLRSISPSDRRRPSEIEVVT